MQWGIKNLFLDVGTITTSFQDSNLHDRVSIILYITNLLRLNRKWITYNRGSNDNFKFSRINYFPTCHNGFRKRLLSIDVRFPSINAKQGVGRNSSEISLRGGHLVIFGAEQSKEPHCIKKVLPLETSAPSLPKVHLPKSIYY